MLLSFARDEPGAEAARAPPAPPAPRPADRAVDGDARRRRRRWHRRSHRARAQPRRRAARARPDGRRHRARHRGGLEATLVPARGLRPRADPGRAAAASAQRRPAHAAGPAARRGPGGRGGAGPHRRRRARRLRRLRRPAGLPRRPAPASRSWCTRPTRCRAGQPGRRAVHPVRRRDRSPAALPHAPCRRHAAAPDDQPSWTAPRARRGARAAFGLDPDLPTLLVSGGSQGARRLNEAVAAAAAPARGGRHPGAARRRAAQRGQLRPAEPG